MADQKRILLVDDHQTVFRLLEAIIRIKGYELIYAESGQQGIVMARQELPALILLDVMMPKMNGYEVCRRIKEVEGLDARVIMFTAYGDAVNIVKAKEVGADEFLAKTEDFANIHRVIKKFLG